MQKNIEGYIQQQPQWQPLLERLRELFLETELEEDYKWQFPTYTIDGKNVVSLGSFKRWAGIWFFHGYLLEDKANKLINAQEEKTHSMRQWRITDEKEVDYDLIMAYVHEAIENQKSGKTGSTPRKRKRIINMPSILQELLDKDATFKTHFEELTPGRQREYMEYIGSAKRAATRHSRLEKCIPMILEGVGLNDKYRK